MSARILPTAREPIEVPDLDDVERSFGRIKAIAAYRRRDTVRSGHTLIAELERGSPLLIKIRDNPTALKLEQAVLQSVLDAGPRTFRVPRPLAWGRLRDGMTWSAQEIVFDAPHRPCLSPLPEFGRDLARVMFRVAAAVEIDDPAPTHDSGLAHGDLTPWNLRVDRHGERWLFDWEDICWAPVGADLAYFAATLGVVRPRRAMSSISVQSADFWSARVSRRLVDGHPTDENVLILRRLTAGAGGAET